METRRKAIVSGRDTAEILEPVEHASDGIPASVEAWREAVFRRRTRWSQESRRMKKSKAETAETRRRIVAAAAEQFRRHGLHETGLGEVMAAAGLTQGGFYRHFKSKDQLIEEACAAGLASVAEATEAAVSQGDGKSGLQAIVDVFLSTDHRDDLWQACPFVALGSELARADDAARAAATAGFKRLVDVVAKRFPRSRPEIAKERAEFIVCAMVGALTMSRMVTDPGLSTSILEDAKKRLTRV